jgi:hypothetical protein
MLAQNYFVDIDEMPMFNWLRCKAGDIESARKPVQNPKKNAFSEEKDLEAWETTYNSYIAYFDWDKNFKEEMRLKNKKTELICDFITTGTRSILNKIDQIDYKLKQLEEQQSGDIEEVTPGLSKWLGFPINMKKITVKEFYKSVKAYGEANK